MNNDIIYDHCEPFANILKLTEMRLFSEIYSPVKKYIYIWTRKQKNADWKGRSMDERRNMDKRGNMDKRERKKYRLRGVKYMGREKEIEYGLKEKQSNHFIKNWFFL